MLCYVMLCYVMLCYVMLCYVMLCYVMLCYVMLCYVMLCYVMLCYVMLCFVILCYVMLCYVMLYFALLFALFGFVLSILEEPIELFLIRYRQNCLIIQLFFGLFLKASQLSALCCVPLFVFGLYFISPLIFVCSFVSVFFGSIVKIVFSIVSETRLNHQTVYVGKYLQGVCSFDLFKALFNSTLLLSSLRVKYLIVFFLFYSFMLYSSPLFVLLCSFCCVLCSELLCSTSTVFSVLC